MTRTLLLFTTLLTGAADTPKVGESKKELKSLQGVWTSVSVESGGIKTVGDQLKKVAGNLEIKADKFTVDFWGGQGTGTLKLDPTKKPKTMDFATDNMLTTQAIYDLDGDKLRICFQAEDGKPRPQEFISKDAFVIISYKREK